MTKLSEHEPDGGKAQAGARLAIEIVEGFGESATAAEPSKGLLDEPALGHADKSLGLLAALDDCDLDAAQGFLQRAPKRRPLIAATGIKF